MSVPYVSPPPAKVRVFALTLPISIVAALPLNVKPVVVPALHTVVAAADPSVHMPVPMDTDRVFVPEIITRFADILKLLASNPPAVIERVDEEQKRASCRT